MPFYKDNAANRRLNRVGQEYRNRGSAPDRYADQGTIDRVAARKKLLTKMKEEKKESTRYGKFANKKETEKTSNWSDKNNTKKDAKKAYMDFSKEMAEIRNSYGKKKEEPKPKPKKEEMKKTLNSMPTKMVKSEEPINTRRRKLERITFKGDKKDVPLLIPRGSKYGLKKKKKMAKGKKTKLDEAGVKKGVRKIEKKRRLSDAKILYDPDNRSDKNYIPNRPYTSTEDAMSKVGRDRLIKARLDAKEERERKERIRAEEYRLGMTQAEYGRMGRAFFRY